MFLDIYSFSLKYLGLFNAYRAHALESLRVKVTVDFSARSARYFSSLSQSPLSDKSVFSSKQQKTHLSHLNK